MMNDVPQTKAVPLQQPVALQSAAMESQGFNPIGDIKVEPSKLSKALTTLNKVVPEAATMATEQLNIRAEEDKTRQTNRALNDLEPTDDATKVGKSAHRMVDVRNQTNEMVLELNEDAATFTGSAEDWEEHVLDKQNQLFSVVGTGEDVLATTGAIFREQLPQSSLIRFRADQKRDQVAKANTATNSFKQAIDMGKTAEEQVNNVKVAWEEMRVAGLATSVQEESFANAAIELAAKNNDLRLIQMSKAMGIFEKRPKLQEAERRARTAIKHDEQEEIFLKKESMEAKLFAAVSAEGLTLDETVKRAAFMASGKGQKDSANQGIWTSPQLSALVDKVHKAVQKKNFDKEDFDASIITDVTGGGTVVDLSIKPIKTQREHVDRYNEFHSKRIEEIESQGLNPAEHDLAVRERMSHKATWLATSGLTEYQWKQQFEDAYAVPVSFYETYEGNELPATQKRAIQIYKDLHNNPEARSAHMTPEAEALFDNYEKNRANGADEIQAMIQAKNQGQFKKPRMSPQMSAEFREDIASEVDDLFSSVIPTFFTGNEDITPAATQKATETLINRAMTHYAASGDKDLAIAKAVGEYANTHTLLSNGSTVKGNLKFLATKMGVSQNPEIVNKILTDLPSQVEAMSEIAGNESLFPNTTTPFEEWDMNVTDDGFVVFEDQFGMPIGRPIALSEAAGFSLEYTQTNNEREEYARKYYAEQKHINNLESYGKTAPKAVHSAGESPVTKARNEAKAVATRREEYIAEKKLKDEKRKAERQANRHKLVEYLRLETGENDG